LIFNTYLQPKGGQTNRHYHTKLTEEFCVLEGELFLTLNQKNLTLKKGEVITIHPYDVHKFTNTTNKTVIFKVEVYPSGQISKGLQIIYGLANSGKTLKNGLPHNIFNIAISLNMMDAYIPNVPLGIQKTGIQLLAFLGKILGIEKKLIRQFVR